jgi:hypothetical protein
MSSRLGVALAVGLVATLALVPELALACPSCAGQRDGGFGRWLVLASMIFLPFAIVWVVARGIKRLDAGGDASGEFTSAETWGAGGTQRRATDDPFLQSGTRAGRSTLNGTKS